MILFALNLAGAVALLLWAVRLIRTGAERAFLNRLRAGLRRASGRPATALLAGTAAAMLLQSSTAVAMLTASFVAAGSLSAAAALVMLLGADLGSALVTQILLLPLGAAIPVLLLAGVTLFLRARRRVLRQVGRILTGLGLVLLSLDMIRAATAPLRDSQIVALVMDYLATDPLSAFAIGAVLALALHSSVAAVLAFVTFVAEGLLPVPAAAALVLGANLGGAAIPVLLTLSAPAPARRVAVGNLMLRGGGAMLALGALAIWPDAAAALGASAARQVLNLHLAFNLAVALAGLPLVGPVLRAVGAVLPDAGAAHRPRISALDDRALTAPERALACTAREVLRMGEAVQQMLAPALGLLRTWDDATAERIAATERDVDSMHFEIKLYVARLQEGRLTPEQSRRAVDLATIANNLEDAGDQVAGNLLVMARRMRAEGLSFSETGWRDLSDFHDRVLSNSQLALNVLMTGDSESARQLVEEKDRTRQTEQQLQVRHLERLRKGTPESIETTNIHQETVRALKQINTAFSLVAYPIAKEAGALLSSRLVAAPTRHS
ncbi:Na/Pi cotransporter family protein [Rhodobacteraceae bacterium 2CG4]|uniref:Na/Pi cotransporter family protein n=1 Tax=Halovulum marinum TaxID=2662447 RepID=A0A6L5Z4J1_9RHOB|nr:Na/Pi cotransporter family protein [Halovulum marinum]MSU90952.1 Na/Pi cotransporter family protein [Halovulum marinum]